MSNYKEFLENKIVVAEKYGMDIYPNQLTEILLDHQKVIVPWCLSGGRRAIFASFGLGKTLMQLELAKLIISITKKPFLICMPLAVVGEFKRDNEMLNTGHEVIYITDSDQVGELAPQIYVTNYDRVRMGDISPTAFGGVSFDEASMLRNLKTDITNYVLKHFKDIQFRFVATATPTPNDFIEILNYADFLGVIDRGHALTRFFQRDSTKAGNLTLYPNKKKEFWQWVSTWAVFINKPSDLGFDDTGYNLPKMNFHEVQVEVTNPDGYTDENGQPQIFKKLAKGAKGAQEEKRTSIAERVAKTVEIVKQHPGKRFILWHHREAEREALEKAFRGYNTVSVFGSQSNAEKEKHLIDFSEGKYDILITKPQIAGSGCNFQHVCHNMIFVGIDYRFNDFIQAIHRIFRFRQHFECNVWALYTNNETDVLKKLMNKWAKHIELNEEMINLVRNYGLNDSKIAADMKRQLFSKPRMAVVGDATVHNNDTVIVHKEMPDNCSGMILTSIPFGDHYEYSDNYNDFGHNNGNVEFFKQMDYLTPELLRTLKPGRIAAVHIKDRIRYSYTTGQSFTTIEDFAADVSHHFRKHGFWLVGKITITTDVVRENNQTYRLTWGEQLKDATKMGVGLPEYVYLFRKAPTTSDNAYADDPVVKKIDDYLLSLWQLDAHAYWKSSGDRFLSFDELSTMDMKTVFNKWRNYDPATIYNFQEHLRVSEDLSKCDRLSKLFMTLPPISNSDMVWTDINRMNTLNANQANRGKEKHICPLQLDIIERLIYRFTNEGDTVDDPFGGLFSTAYVALDMKRKAIAAELKPEYYDDGLFYLKSKEYKVAAQSLFDLLETN